MGFGNCYCQSTSDLVLLSGSKCTVICAFAQIVLIVLWCGFRSGYSITKVFVSGA